MLQMSLHRYMASRTTNLCQFRVNAAVKTSARLASTQPDVAELRRDTPGTSSVIHFNNAGSALPTRQVLGACKDYLDLEATIGGYEAVRQEAEALELVYSALAELLNCHPDEIAVVESATAAWQQVFYGIPFGQGDRIITSSTEYAANFIAFLQVSKRTGTVIELIPEDEHGDFDIPALHSLIKNGSRKPALLAVCHIPTSSGHVYDAAAVGAVARQHGVPYLLDACQSAGQVPLDVQELGCDWLTGTGRKYLRGPRGTGFLYASRRGMELCEPAHLDLWGADWDPCGTGYTLQPTALRYESYEISFAAKVGLGVAVDYVNRTVGMAWAWERIRALAALLRRGLAAVPGVVVRDHGRVQGGIVTFTKEGLAAADIVELLGARGINTHLTPLDRFCVLESRARGGLPAVARASVHYYNSEAEVAALVAAVAEL